jgi:hypothetical protein
MPPKNEFLGVTTLDSKKYMIIIVCMGLVILALAGGMIYLNSSVISRVVSPTATSEVKSVSTSAPDSATFKELLATDEAQKNDAKLADALSKNARLKMRLMCPLKILNVDYNTNELVAASILAHIQKYYTDTPVTNDWTPIYDRNQSAIHNFYWGNNQYTLIVFFNSAEFGTTNGIFDTVFQCWANLNNE